MISFKGDWKNFGDITKESTSSSSFVLSSQFVDSKMSVNEMLDDTSVERSECLVNFFYWSVKTLCGMFKDVFADQKKKHELSISQTFIAKG